MRPRPKDRGNLSRQPLALKITDSRFNEAATKRSRKHGAGGPYQSSGHHASMRPRPKDRGNDPGEKEALERALSFNEAATKRSRKPPIHDQKGNAMAASMRPRPKDRGNHVQAAESVATTLASMRPRPKDRGNARPISTGSGCSEARFNEAATKRSRKLMLEAATVFPLKPLQ